MFKQLGLIGCGLMGGSFALALKRAGLVGRVIGFSQSSATRDRAVQLGVIDIAATSAEQAAAGADLVLIAVPVAATEITLQAIEPLISPDMLVMDVGSTKSDVVTAGQRILGSRMACLVPAHPIAGKEVAGIEHADVNLYRGCQVILTPTEQTRGQQVQQAQALWRALGCQVRQMSAAAHDAAFAAVSHLPHLLAFAYLNALAGQAQGADFLSLAGPGFRDFSRIAAADPKVWRDILLTNQQELLVQTRLFQNELAELEKAISAGNSAELERLIQQASQARSNWRMASKTSAD
ncbi:MAG: prephenate dehydrogenase/arogenate dehydrogenase family protein [Burkholderiaceae bacterium]